MKATRKFNGDTGIYVRVQREDGTWGTADIGELDSESLFKWLNSHDPHWAINVVGLLLGHGHIAGGCFPVKLNLEEVKSNEL